jgi:hypothetical protein
MAGADPLAALRAVATLGAEADHHRLNLGQVDLDLLVGRSLGERAAAVRTMLQGNRDRLLYLLFWRGLPSGESPFPRTAAWTLGLLLGFIPREGSRLAAPTA